METQASSLGLLITFEINGSRMTPQLPSQEGLKEGHSLLPRLLACQTETWRSIFYSSSRSRIWLDVKKKNLHQKLLKNKGRY